ncbi:hypothetical protein PRIPAC_80360 [Pristionchus pacificus]|uniref:Uncharacterized protein n=1 Tax=Pristionchus pacificus TaxID=54126 RepID=A0A2A6C405_PRIPA|nr:hypothetical protein PRIPAC_80360 [Pristionchus pacificus]|eukprot:PDM72837.1 hypothetical protein PRIPAC_39271 [Pristionchus pacificus]
MMSIRQFLRLLRSRRSTGSSTTSSQDANSLTSSSTPTSSRSVSFADADLWPFIDDDVPSY